MAIQERARRTREKVLTAAAEEFAALGYSRATLGAVAERTGMTKGALYGHFSSKKLLAGALIDEARQVWAHLRAEHDTPGVDGRSVLESVVIGFARRLQSDVRLRAAVRLASECPAFGCAFADVLADVQNALMALVRRAQRDSEFPAYSPRLVAHLLMTVIYGLLHAPAQSGERGGMPVVEPLWRLLFTALSADQVSVAGLGEDDAVSGA
ncbi:TetR/AcrR family transcriptional regulator [Streptomyces sp. NBC_00102]|uniref:TetR/AcrR family transcriptional regulator n=1 Tax=Streptomyces sp. NBC_00102 TaxID=2975652 RepID=UPI00225A2E25|nr:TetR/AcrR family transcriptional regulator [Streptomyces sp. NBC_00102]MCX5401504.1 TetR/AcrR family transcriptional regulator [Streptomyces sp. NBC_00102]